MIRFPFAVLRQRAIIKSVKTFLVNRLTDADQVIATVAIFLDQDAAEALRNRLNALAAGLQRGEDGAVELIPLDPELAPGLATPAGFRGALANVARYACEEADLRECGCGGG